MHWKKISVGTYLLFSVWEFTVLSPSWDSGQQGTVCSTCWGLPCVCGGDSGRGCVDSKHWTACFPLSGSTSKDSYCLRKKPGRGGKRKEKGVRNGSFSGKVILSVDVSVCPSRNALLWTRWSCLTLKYPAWHLYIHSHPGPCLRACHLHLDPVSPWPSDLELVRSLHWA